MSTPAEAEPNRARESDVPATPSDPESLQAAYDELSLLYRGERARHSEDFRQFAYSVAHDLREPLRMVSSYTQLLGRRYDAKLDQDGREFMRIILDATQRMDRLLTDLLTYSQQANAALKPLSLVSPEVALQGVLLNLDLEIRKNEASITHDPLPEVLYDFAQLSQLFRQLIANALKFRSEAALVIHISVESSEAEHVFVVRDNGIGIDPRYHEQIFGVFRKLHGRDFPGTGIGLALCKRIVEQYGGRIWVESELGEGAAFKFTVPV